MSPYARASRLIGIIFLSNVALIGLAAFFRHAGAQEDARTNATVNDKNTNPGDDLMPPVVEQPTQPALPLPQAPGAGSSGPVEPGFVLDEIKKMIQDPASGLDVKPLEYPSLELGPGSDGTAGAVGVGGTGSSSERSASMSALQLRLSSIARLSEAAMALAEEADALARAGQAGQVQQLIEQITQLRRQIARLAETP